MNGWNEGITHAIAYMEENLAEEIGIKIVASQRILCKCNFPNRQKTC